jgi:septum formation protein
VRPAHIDEAQHAGEPPRAYAERLAREKAHKVAEQHPEAVVIGADTIVVVDGDVLGKPDDDASAMRMLQRLSGRGHVVDTAVAVVRDGRAASAVEEVAVQFRTLSDVEIARYIETGEPMDKAGAYGIQGYGATIVERVDGDYFAVMGLPLGLLVRLLRRVGVRYDFGTLSDA